MGSVEGQSACLVRVVPAGELKAWAAGARPGDRFVYFTGPALVPGPTARVAAALHRAGLAELFTLARTDCAGRDWIVERVGPRGGRGRKARLAVRDPAAAKILAAFRRAAEAGRAAQSNAALARIAGLATRDQAAGKVAKLIAEGRIRTETWAGPNGPVRVVEIVSNGTRTAMPRGVAS